MQQPEFYPLYLLTLTDREQELLFDILALGKRLRVFTQKELESESNLSFKHILSPRNETDIARHERIRATRNKGGTFSHEKLAWLYNYVMGDFRKLCELKRHKDLLQKIDALHELGLRSGRYASDMHLFNWKHLKIDTRDALVNQAYLSGPYIGFRRGSEGAGLVVSIMEVRMMDSRFVFTATTLGDVSERTTNGICYEINRRLFMFGLRAGGFGAEYFALQPLGPEHNILFGIVSTGDRNGVPHAKQCFFIRSNWFEALAGYKFDLFTHPLAAMAELDGMVERIAGDPSRVVLLGQPPIPTARFLSPSIVKPQDTQEQLKVEGPTH